MTGARTYSGPVSFTLQTRDGGATLTWRSRLAAGARICGWPFRSGAGSVRAEGLSADRRTILPAGRPGTLDITWRLRGPVVTYESAVAELQKSYARPPADRRQPQEDRHGQDPVTAAA